MLISISLPFVLCVGSMKLATIHQDVLLARQNNLVVDDFVLQVHGPKGFCLVSILNMRHRKCPRLLQGRVRATSL